MVVLLTAAALGANEPAELGLSWEEPSRYYIETEVQLPLFMWLAKRFNEQARTNAFVLRFNTQCEAAEPVNKRLSTVLCTLEDISLSASALPADAGLLGPVLTEVDERLTGEVIQLQVRNDGRIFTINFDDIDRRNRRVGEINENLRLMLTRAFAGLDFQVRPNLEIKEGQAWAQYESWLMRAASSYGSAGYSELIHQVTMVDGPLVKVETVGKGTMEPSGTKNRYSSRVSSAAVINSRTEQIIERQWTLLAHPTASSAIAEGTAGYPYAQWGRVVNLPEGMSFPVGESVEMAPPGESQSSIQRWQGLGLNIHN